jgi:pimeloyl-ACP methyl ester carboxylesterase
MLPAGFLGTMSLHFILVAGPLVRASSWEPTAECLRAAGCHVRVPDVLAHHRPPPSWRAWTSQLLEHVTGGHEPIVVGHSSASVLAADLATRLPARGIIIVDGEVPPSQGAAFPVRPALRDFIKGLVEPDGMLPIWSRWFARDMQRMCLVGVDILARDAAAFARFESGLPRMYIGWFDDAIELANWDYIPAGFIQTSAIYDHAAIAAQQRGWPVTNLRGTHLHPTLHPAETANAILAMSRQLVSGGNN